MSDYIIRRETTVHVPAAHGMIRIIEKPDHTSATPAANKHAIMLDQLGEYLWVLESEVDDLVAAIVEARDLFRSERDAEMLRLAKLRPNNGGTAAD